MGRLLRLILATLLVVACPAVADDTGGGDGRESLPAHEVFQLRVEDGGLVLRTTMPPTPEEEIRGFDLTGTTARADLVTSGSTVDDAGVGGATRRAVVPDYFKLEVGDNDQPGQRVGILVSWHDGALDIQHNVHFTGDHRYTRLTRLLASRNPEFGTRPSVQLMVNEHGNIGRVAIEVNLRAADFVALRREHESAVDEHLRPLLRELGQESVLSPDLRAVRLVFPDRFQPDEAAVRAVQELLPALGARDGDAREAASAQLVALGDAGILAILHLERGPLSAEQNSRIDAAIAAGTSLTRTEAARRRRDVGFLLDCLNSDDAATRGAGLESLLDLVSEPIEFDPELQPLARGVAVAKLREKLQGSGDTALKRAR